jgi:hypothetical protein
LKGTKQPVKHNKLFRTFLHHYREPQFLKKNLSQNLREALIIIIGFWLSAYLRLSNEFKLTSANQQNSIPQKSPFVKALFAKS